MFNGKKFDHPLTDDKIEILELNDAKKIIKLLIAQLKFFHQMNEEKAELINFLQAEIEKNNFKITRH